MRRQLSRLLALPLTAAVLLLPIAPALAQEDEPTIPTTPVPETKGEAPASAPIGPQPLGHAVGAAGTALGIARLLPKSQPTQTIMPGFGEKLGKQALLEAGMILTSARANSEAYLSYERSIAQACPGGIAVKGDAPQAPGCVTQTALPDNPEPRTSGFNPSPNPLIDAGLVNGSAHARWSPTLGPCVGTIADSSESLASLSLLPEIPSMGTIEQLAGTSEQLRAVLGNVGPLATLGGLLPGKQAAAKDDSSGGLINLPNTMSTRSTVRLVDVPGSENKAVQSVSTLQLADMHLFQGTPLAIDIKVVSQPTLTVTSTGNAETSSVDYQAPVLAVYRHGEKKFTLDAAHPSESIGVGIPTDPGKLADALGMAPDQLKDAPVIGGLVETAQHNAKALTEDAQGFVVDLFAIKLSIADLDVEKRQKTKPFTGYQIGASARMMNLEILPTEKLTGMLPADAKKQVPPSLAQVAFGEQVVRAYAPEGGVVCGTTTPAAQPPEGGAAPGVPEQLAQTSAAYATVPLFWGGTGLLLVGVVMVSALPGRRRPGAATAHTPKPSPHPRSPSDG